VQLDGVDEDLEQGLDAAGGIGSFDIILEMILFCACHSGIPGHCYNAALSGQSESRMSTRVDFPDVYAWMTLFSR